jgi:hypothetical protein
VRPTLPPHPEEVVAEAAEVVAEAHEAVAVATGNASAPNRKLPSLMLPVVQLGVVCL